MEFLQVVQQRRMTAHLQRAVSAAIDADADEASNSPG
jgi:hypothetical protein